MLAQHAARLEDSSSMLTPRQAGVLRCCIRTNVHQFTATTSSVASSCQIPWLKSDAACKIFF